MPIMSGWEVSPDRIEKYNKIMSTDDVGDPIITSKCKLSWAGRGMANGYIVVSNNGIAWRIYGGSYVTAGKSVWVRWFDVSRIDRKKDGFLIVKIKRREPNGSLWMDRKGNLKLKQWSLKLKRNKYEDNGHFLQRRSDFYNILSDIFNQNKGDSDPPTSDSRI